MGRRRHREKLKEVIETLGEWGCRGRVLNIVNVVGREALDEKVAFESKSEEDEGMILENE